MPAWLQPMVQQAVDALRGVPVDHAGGTVLAERAPPAHGDAHQDRRTGGRARARTSPGRGGSMPTPPLRTIWISERVVSVESNLTLAHAVMHLPQPSHLAGSKAMVE